MGTLSSISKSACHTEIASHSFKLRLRTEYFVRHLQCKSVQYSCSAIIFRLLYHQLTSQECLLIILKDESTKFRSNIQTISSMYPMSIRSRYTSQADEGIVLILSLNADKGLKEGLRFGARTKTLLELCERGFQM